MKLRTFIFIAVAVVTVFSALALAADPPEKVEIKQLENLYEPCQFDHKMHTDVAPKCETCHHKGGTDGPNAACSHCHKIPFDRENLGVIGFKGALHQQCMDCHAKQGAKNDCEVCHAKKK